MVRAAGLSWSVIGASDGSWDGMTGEGGADGGKGDKYERLPADNLSRSGRLLSND